MARYLITGGLGFIGSNFIRYLLDRDENVRVLNFDKQTYAGNPVNLRDVERDPRYDFVRSDICDASAVEEAFSSFAPDIVINFAAESHVDRSIGSPDEFIQTDVFGVFVLLEASRRHGVDRFLQISTDEVYGSIESGKFTEVSSLEPSSPYAASKAGGDRLAYSYFATYGLPVVITRASNNFGPFQYPEKLIPLFVTNAIDDEPLPVYGDGRNVRDWLFVEDHCDALRYLIEHGAPGEVYNIGGKQELENIEITHKILELLGKPASLIRYVEDRKGHDRRYALETAKLDALGWTPSHDFDAALAETVRWYEANTGWWRPIKRGEFKEFYRRQYGGRL